MKRIAFLLVLGVVTWVLQAPPDADQEQPRAPKNDQVSEGLKLQAGRAESVTTRPSRRDSHWKSPV